MKPRTFARRPTSIGSNQLSKSRPSASPARADVILLIMVWSPPALQRRNQGCEPRRLRHPIPTTSATAPSAFGRLEVVETGRRGRWSEDQKARIVLESLAGPRLVSATARRHGISRSQLLAWRRTLRPQRSEAGAVPGFVPAVIVSE